MRTTEAFAHPHAGAAVTGDETTDKLEKIRIMSDNEHVLPVGVFFQELLKVGIGGIEVKR